MNCASSGVGDGLRLEDLAVRDGVGWERVHRELMLLSKRKAGLDYEEADWLVIGDETRVYSHLGHRSYRDYLCVVFGYSPREAKERLMVARRLTRLPKTKAALRDGTQVWSGVRELSRVVTGETEDVWLEATKNKSVRQIEAMVSGLSEGDLPDDPKDPDLIQHVLRFEVTGATYALWKEAAKKIRAERGAGLSEDEVFEAIARMVLSGPDRDAGRSSYQIAVTVCDDCMAATIDGGGEAVPVDDAVFEMACCDAQHIGDVQGDPRGSASTVGKRKRATQTIPPALRREVIRRDHGGCVLDCCAAPLEDLHHLNWDNMDHRSDNLAGLCSTHHKMVHAGRLILSGIPSAGLSFFHADGTPFGERGVDATAAKLTEGVFEQLKAMGVAARKARDVVDAITALGELPDPAIGEALARQQLLAAALSYLRQ